MVDKKLLPSGPHQYPGVVKNVFKFIYKKTGFPYRGLIYYMVTRYEGGEYWSTTLREIFQETYNIRVGIGSYGCFRPIAIPNGTVIGNYCSFAENVRFIGSNHPQDHVSTHPMFCIPSLGYVNQEKVARSTTTVGHDVWIGWNSLILSNCRQIGTGAIVAAGSVVTTDVEPYTVMAGVPAKPIRQRFRDEIICKLLDSRWFLLSPLELGQIVDASADPETFLLKLDELRKVNI